MADEMPKSSAFTGLSRKVIAYSEAFQQVIARAKHAPLTEADWAPFEAIVDTDRFERQGQFSGPQAERFGWDVYKRIVTEYGGATNWEGTLRHITEQGNRVILELEERNTAAGVTDVSNTVTTYAFDDAGKLVRLEVYIMPIEKRAAA